MKQRNTLLAVVAGLIALAGTVFGLRQCEVPDVAIPGADAGVIVPDAGVDASSDEDAGAER